MSKNYYLNNESEKLIKKEGYYIDPFWINTDEISTESLEFPLFPFKYWDQNIHSEVYSNDYQFLSKYQYLGGSIDDGYFDEISQESKGITYEPNINMPEMDGCCQNDFLTLIDCNGKPIYNHDILLNSDTSKLFYLVIDRISNKYVFINKNIKDFSSLLNDAKPMIVDQDSIDPIVLSRKEDKELLKSINSFKVIGNINKLFFDKVISSKQYKEWTIYNEDTLWVYYNKVKSRS